MKKERLHTITICMGVLTALVVVCSQLFFFQTARYVKKEIKTEKHEKQQDSDDLNVTLPSFSQPSSAHVEANQESCCLFQILFEKSKGEDHSDQLSFSFSKLFKTLFRVIIA